MNCPKCNNPIALKKNRCDCCGLDIRIYSKIVKSSNAYYNMGLVKSKVRDLTGAVVALKQSLELYKKNTNARNLLGLVYYEMGETVSALSEWVISKHFQSQNNDADEYIAAIQQNPTKLDMINQAIKKYNTALISAKQGSGDLAIIQLKKVISLNSKFLRAHQLLALLYMQSGEREKAERILLKALKVDVNNTLTLKYLKETGRSNVKSDHTETAKVGRTINELGTKDYTSIVPVSSYKEEKPNIWAYVNLLIGVIIGVAAVYFLIVPTIKEDSSSTLNQQVKEYSQQLSEKNAELISLEQEKLDLQDKVDSLQATVDSAKTEEPTTTANTTGENDKALLAAAKLFVDGKDDEAALKLLEVQEASITLTEAKDLYNTIKEQTFEDASKSVYNEGHSQYSKGKYEEAIATLTKAVLFNEENTDALYFIGRSYHNLEQIDKAKEYYNKIVTEFPNKRRYYEAKNQLNKLD